MRKLNLSSKELQALYPPMSQAFESTITNTLHALSQRKEQPVMKKKISAALVVAIILIILTLSAAIALTQSELLGFLFGKDNPPPIELEEIVSRPETVIKNPDVKVTLNEYLYDGERLYLHWSVDRQTDKQIMVNMSPFKVDDEPLFCELAPYLQSSDYYFGNILGGMTDRVTMPGSVSCNAIYTNPQDEISPELFHTLVRGETLKITSTIYVWEVLHEPEVIAEHIYAVHTPNYNPANFKGLPADTTGLCLSAWIPAMPGREEPYSLEEIQKSHEENGWAKLAATYPITFTLTLNTKEIQQLQPVQTRFDTDAFTLDISRMVYMQTGGTIALHVQPKNPDPHLNEIGMTEYDFAILNAQNGVLLSTGVGISSTSEGYKTLSEDYYIQLKPLSGDMPKSILIVPGKYNPKWDSCSDSYDPDAKVTSLNGLYYDHSMEDALKVDLE